MDKPEIDLLAHQRGTVTAPAGCGKTQLIAQALRRYSERKPILVLTHTNAGVAALRGRLNKEGVSSRAYRVLTIDGWALRLISTFPARSGHDPKILALGTPNRDYPAIREAAWNLLKAGHLSDVLRATYARLWVDEYQDCSLPQHAIIGYASRVLPTCVLGDPMQAIFGFAGPTVDWALDVHKHFPPIGELKTPWRWKNVGTDGLGHWLLEARHRLQAGDGIDLRTAPPEVTWIQLQEEESHQQRLDAARTNGINREGHVLIIGDSTNPRGQREMASQTPGAITVEAVDLKDLTTFGRTFDLKVPQALEHLVAFAGELMTNIGAPVLLQRIQSLQNGTARKEASSIETAGIAFRTSPGYGTARAFLKMLSDQPGGRVYRPEILRCCLDALRLASGGKVSFRDATIAVREQNRLTGRALPRRAVGSTLLLKGLEADIAVILNPEGMDEKHLYVALTRGARQVVVCSHRPVIGVKVPTAV